MLFVLFGSFGHTTILDYIRHLKISSTYTTVATHSVHFTTSWIRTVVNNLQLKRGNPLNDTEQTVSLVSCWMSVLQDTVQ